MRLIFEKISRKVNRDGFDCGVPDLNEFLLKYALQNLRKNVGVTIVATSDEDRKRVLGCYSVSMAQVEFDQMPEGPAKGLPRYPVPAMRLGRLAVDVSTGGRGVGAELLRDTLIRAVGLSREVGTRVVLVDAIDDTVKAFYLRYGFVPLQDVPLTRVLPIETIASAFAAAE